MGPVLQFYPVTGWKTRTIVAAKTVETIPAAPLYLTTPSFKTPNVHWDLRRRPPRPSSKINVSMRLSRFDSRRRRLLVVSTFIKSVYTCKTRHSGCNSCDLLFQINSLIYVYPRFYDLIPIASLSILIAILIS